jgi:hypothetical protein
MICNSRRESDDSGVIYRHLCGVEKASRAIVGGVLQAAQPDGLGKDFNQDGKGDGFGPPSLLLEGFVVVKSPVALDVVGVYTARHTDGEVETMDVETIPSRQMREIVKLTPPAAGPKLEKHIEYPPKGSPAYGGKEQQKIKAALDTYHRKLF